MPRERSRDEVERELEFLKKRRLVDGLAAVLANLIRYGGAVLIVYFGITRPIEALAGRITYTDITVAILAKLKSGDWSIWALIGPWVLVLIFAVYGLVQRKLRRDTVEQLQSRIQAFEKERDPGRGSSTLTTRGDTRREDKL